MGGTTTTYLQDTVGGLPRVLVETTDSQQTLFVYGLGLAWEVRPDGTHRYYHADSLGSTRIVTDDAGSPVSAYSYDAYGAVRASAGEARSFTYTGEQTDDYTKFVYLRARYLDPDTGRFLSRDSILPDPASTQGINRHGYVQANLILSSDPSGRCFEDGCLVEIAVATYLIQNWPQIQQEAQVLAPYILRFAQQAGPQLVGLAERFRNLVQAEPVCGQKIGFAGGSRPQSIPQAIRVGQGFAIQEHTPEALAVRDQVAQGATLYKGGWFEKAGQFPGSIIEGAQFWSTENPLTTPNYAIKYGVPIEQLFDFVVTSALKLGADFITRAAVPIGRNTGGAIEVVVNAGSTTIKSFYMP